MRRLKRAGHGRAGIIVPNGTLFGDGVAARIKADLLTQFNLHTIVRLPEGVFSPYADVATNLLFFDTTEPTNEIWYWEHKSLKVGVDTQRLNPFNTKSSPLVSNGGKIEPKDLTHGRCVRQI